MEHSTWSQKTVLFLAVSLGKPLDLSESQCSHQQNGASPSTNTSMVFSLRFMNDGESYHFSSAYHVLGTLPILSHSVHNKTLWRRHWKLQLRKFSNTVSGKARIQTQIHWPQNLCSFHLASHPGSCMGKGLENCEGLGMWLLLFLYVALSGFMLSSSVLFLPIVSLKRNL